MPIKEIDGYEVEYTGELLEGTDRWGAFVSIYIPSDNPMHLNNIYPKRRVSMDVVLTDQHAAEAEAERVAPMVLKELCS
ncbi:MAG: hypothetical protein V4463_03165 [Pseudomonadota bacterium]